METLTIRAFLVNPSEELFQRFHQRFWHGGRDQDLFFPALGSIKKRNCGPREMEKGGEKRQQSSIGGVLHRRGSKGNLE